jgi:hypothetical protein
MADIGLNPPQTRHDRVVSGVATETGIKFGDVLVWDVATTNQHRAVKRNGTAGEAPLAGVCVTQTDPTNGSAVGDNLEICDLGIVETNLVTTTAIVKGDKIIASGTAGQVKKLAGETTPDVLGRAMQDMASTSGVVRIAVNVNIYQHA